MIFNRAEEQSITRAIENERTRRPKVTPAMRADLALLLKPAVEVVAARRVDEQAKKKRRGQSK